MYGDIALRKMEILTSSLQNFMPVLSNFCPQLDGIGQPSMFHRANTR